MKRLLMILTVLTAMCFCMIAGGCENTDEGTEANVAVPPFADIKWTREVPEDTEYLKFSSDGSFTYSCACGNSVNDSDVCEGYLYNPEENSIEFICIETTEEMVTYVQVISWDDDELVLDFNGDIRKFVKE